VLNCREVSRLVSSDELASAGGILRLRVRFHLLICRECRRYADQMRIIGNVAREVTRSLAIDTKVLARLENSILENARGGTNQLS
jgi:F420-0:gamma-glutamyl ligase-like protein